MIDYERCFFCKKEKDELTDIDIDRLNNSIRLLKSITVKICPYCSSRKNQKENQFKFENRTIKK
jgi:hypothetical protein